MTTVTEARPRRTRERNSARAAARLDDMAVYDPRSAPVTTDGGTTQTQHAVSPPPPAPAEAEADQLALLQKRVDRLEDGMREVLQRLFPAGVPHNGTRQ